MSVERVKEYLKRFGLDGRVRELPESSATVALAAMALRCGEGEIAKSLTFMVSGEPIMIVAAGDARIDNHKYKEEFGAKAKMLTPDDVRELIGHEVGGVCPFAVNDEVKVYLDKTLRKYEVVYPACGSSNSAVGMTIEELERSSGFLKWVDICKDAG